MLPLNAYIEIIRIIIKIIIKLKIIRIIMFKEGFRFTGTRRQRCSEESNWTNITNRLEMKT